MRKYLIFWNRCKKCGYEFETLSDPSDYSIRLLLSVKTQKPAIVMCDIDPAFKEIYKMVEEYFLPKGYPSIQIAEIFDEIFGKICDLAPDGSSYDMSGRRRCIKCKSDNIDYGPTEPPVYREEVLPKVSHTSWDNYTYNEKAVLVEQLIKGEKIRIGH